VSPIRSQGDLQIARWVASRGVGPLGVVADDAEDLHFTRAGRGQQQIRIVAPPASRAYQGRGLCALNCAELGHAGALTLAA
jgi:hypothetical protein